MSAYGTIPDTATASVAMDLAVQELSAQMKCEHAKWQQFVMHCIDNNADPELIDSQLKLVNLAARARILC